MNPLRRALLQARRRTGGESAFAEPRDYACGDDARWIDWAASARGAGLKTRVFRDEPPLTFGAIADRSPSMNAGRRLPLAHAAEAMLNAWFDAADPGDLVVSLDSFSDAAGLLPPGAVLLAAGDFWESQPRNDLLCALTARCDCTVMIARDPWCDALPLSGFVTVEDAENGTVRQLFLGRSQRERYVRAARRRERDLCDRFAAANWRVGTFSEEDTEGALLRIFGLS